MIEIPTLPPLPAAQVGADTDGRTRGGADARAERAALRLGVQAAEVERLPFDLSVLEDEGLFVVRRATHG